MLDSVFYSKAIQKLRPTSGFVIEGTDYSTLIWRDENTTKPTEQEILEEFEILKAAYEAQDYARKRVEEYPLIGDQLDALFHAGVFPEDMAAQIQAIKDKYPKS
jgi:hypothetical protein